jgi:CheY-like chemotaxis protein
MERPLDISDPIALEAISLIKYALWPGVLLLSLLLFHAPLTRLLDRVQTLRAEGTARGFNIALATASLTTAEAQKGGAMVTGPADLAAIVEQAARSIDRQASQRSVLWVDDIPSKNTNERAALSALGLEFSLATSTAEAKAILKSRPFALIISDFRRDNDPESGYMLLEYVKMHHPSIPYVIYSGTAEPELVRSAIKKGALGQTNRPYELFGLVVTALQQNQTDGKARSLGDRATPGQ